MQTVIGNLVKLGLKEYEARIYVALVGLGEANVRTIHEVSRVPRSRVYDILGELTSKGFVEVREGSPLVYRTVPPDIVVSALQKEMNKAAEDSIDALETLSLNARQKYVPLWYLQGDWSITNHLKAIIDRVGETLLILALDTEVTKRYASLIGIATQKCHVKIIFKEGAKGSFVPVPGASHFEIGDLSTFFREHVLEKMYASPVTWNSDIFVLECIILADDREHILIFTLNGERMGVINMLPFIINIQKTSFAHMLAGARELFSDAKDNSV